MLYNFSIMKAHADSAHTCTDGRLCCNCAACNSLGSDRRIFFSFVATASEAHASVLFCCEKSLVTLVVTVGISQEALVRMYAALAHAIAW